MPTHNEPPSRPPAPAPPGAAPTAVRLLVLLGLMGLVVLALLPMRPPQALGPDVEPDRFSAGRALEDVAVVAAEPHPTGTPAHARVRAHLEDRLRALGLETEVQRETLTGEGDDAGRVVRVQNVLGRLPGRGEGGAVLLVAHYDSVPGSPGASDDGAGVAALLETARALQREAPLARDVLFLFTDAEELGLFGARAFAERHPAMEEVDFVLNFEARGTSGPSYMFETGREEALPVSLLAQAVPEAVAASYSVDVYRRLPNDTDFTVFRERGLPGFNFAFIEGLSHYHSSRDTVDNLSRASLQHHGSYALGLARHLASSTEEIGTGGGGTGGGTGGAYFNLVGVGLVVVPVPIVWAALAVGVVLIVFLAFRGSRRGRNALRPFLLTLVTFPVSLGLAFLAGGLLARFHLDWVDATPMELGTDPWLLAAVGVAGAAAVLAVPALAARRSADLFPVVVAVLAWWSVLAVAVQLTLPGGGYLLALPLPTAAAILAVLLPGLDDRPALRLVLLALCLVPALLLWVPLLMTLGSSLGIPGGGVVAVVAALLMGLSIPLLDRLLASTRGPLAAGAAAVLALALWIVAGVAADPPPTTSLAYLLDTEAEQAVWVSFDSEGTEWTERFLGEAPERQAVVDFFPGRQVEAYVAEAPVFDLEPPVVEVAEDVLLPGGGQRLALRVRAVRPDASRLRVALRGDLGSVSVEGQPVPVPEPGTGGEEDGQAVEISLYGEAQRELRVEVEVEQGPLRVTAVDRAYGFPAGSGPEREPRPAGQLPARSGATDFTAVRGSRVFPPRSPQVTAPPPG